jgi:hypothetical protein
MEGIAPHPKYPKTQVRPPLIWLAGVRQLNRRRLAVIGVLGIGSAGLGLWFIGIKAAPPDSKVLDLTGGVPSAINGTVEGHRQTGR